MVSGGTVSGGRVLDVEAAASALGLDLDPSPQALYKGGKAGLDRYRALANGGFDPEPYLLDESDLEFEPVVPTPRKILCVGLNYRRHAIESGMKVPSEPVLFSKFDNSLAGHGATVSIAGLEQVDYESELAVVIGTEAKNVAVEEALDHVLGYTLANDLSERKLQMVSGQWLIGKTLDGFLPLGPYFVTADEVPDPQRLAIRGWLNGELRQDSNTSDMIFSVAQIIAYASRYMTLLRGDVISTGTPEGVVLGMAEKKWVRPGDEYVVEVEGLGRLSTRLC
jgi:2-keto-4-pentenoate hydratase/2-oxohepta-3-ene-1,7-dioic acid hydratase in catechol pathway